MMPYGWHDGGWGVLWMILSWGLIVAIMWGIFHALTPDRDRRETEHDPKEVLAERFARGEIDSDEYRERLKVLNETGTAEARR